MAMCQKCSRGETGSGKRWWANRNPLPCCFQGFHRLLTSQGQFHRICGSGISGKSIYDKERVRRTPGTWAGWRLAASSSETDIMSPVQKTAAHGEPLLSCLGGTWGIAQDTRPCGRMKHRENRAFWRQFCISLHGIRHYKA